MTHNNPPLSLVSFSVVPSYLWSKISKGKISEINNSHSFKLHGIMNSVMKSALPSPGCESLCPIQPSYVHCLRHLIEVAVLKLTNAASLLVFKSPFCSSVTQHQMPMWFPSFHYKDEYKILWDMYHIHVTSIIACCYNFPILLVIVVNLLLCLIPNFIIGM